MNENLITWNIHNWITVFLMFLAGWAILALGVRGIQHFRGQNSGTQPAQQQAG